jgi:hypothetical protein
MPQTTQYLRFPRWLYWKFPDPPNPIVPPPLEREPDDPPQVQPPIQKPQFPIRPQTRRPPDRSVF